MNIPLLVIGGVWALWGTLRCVRILRRIYGPHPYELPQSWSVWDQGRIEYVNQQREADELRRRAERWTTDRRHPVWGVPESPLDGGAQQRQYMDSLDMQSRLTQLAMDRLRNDTFGALDAPDLARLFGQAPRGPFG
jgi:hypothetical protein